MSDKYLTPREVRLRTGWSFNFIEKSYRTSRSQKKSRPRRLNSNRSCSKEGMAIANTELLLNWPKEFPILHRPCCPVEAVMDGCVTMGDLALGMGLSFDGLAKLNRKG